MDSARRPSPTPPAPGDLASASHQNDATSEDTSPAPEDFGRVADDGTVYVRTRAGERQVGQWPDGDPAEALEFFGRRFEALELEVSLLEKRVGAGTVAPEQANRAVKQVRSTIVDAHAVGDLDSLLDRLEALVGKVDERREERKAQRLQELAAARTAKEKIAVEAERIAGATTETSPGSAWRSGGDRLGALLDEWKKLPRANKRSGKSAGDQPEDDELWKRFSTARNSFMRARKQHFAELSAHRSEAATVKEKLAAEAESLSASTDWGKTASAYRDLMQRWKAAGPAPRGVDQDLWKRFRGAQDTFFAARDAANAKIDEEFKANGERKQALLAEAEKLLPVKDPGAARKALRDLAGRWDTIGKVPRDSIRKLEGRLRDIEQAVRDAETKRLDRSDPEKRGRAASATAQLEESIAALEGDLAKAKERGDDRGAKNAEDALAAKRMWLDSARRALSDFSA